MGEDSSQDGTDDTTDDEAVWTYRGYQLRASEFTTAMVHFFRAEVQRANVWRQRLDTTTNWAVVSTGAAITVGFRQGGNQAAIVLNLLLVTIFLSIEARRYRYYELWSYRVRLIETDFYAPMLVPPFHPSPEWAEAFVWLDESVRKQFVTHHTNIVEREVETVNYVSPGYYSEPIYYASWPLLPSPPIHPPPGITNCPPLPIWPSQPIQPVAQQPFNPGSGKVSMQKLGTPAGAIKTRAVP